MAISVNLTDWVHSLWDLANPRPPPHCLGSLRASWVLGAWFPQWWQLGRAWGPGPEEATSWDLSSVSQDQDLGRGELCLGTLPFLSDQKMTFVWWTFIRMSLADQDLTSRTKDLTPRSYFLRTSSLTNHQSLWVRLLCLLLSLCHPLQQPCSTYLWWLRYDDGHATWDSIIPFNLFFLFLFFY